ncbi:MAG: FAD:protein FMN transferase [Proteobacteria bacterium]|nr:FAD:protein FMN transferase [Pseudomonadota bacterium]
MVLCSLSLLFWGCSNPTELKTLAGPAQGTTWEVKFWSTEPVDTEPVVRANLEIELERIDLALSNFRPDSTIELFNTSRSTDALDVGSEIVALVQIARLVSQASQGCYDLTIGPLWDLWGFSGDQLTPPSTEEIQATLVHIGFHKIEILTPDRLRKQKADLQIDLSSIAQGYTVGRLADVLEASGIENYLAEIGGEIRTRGRKPDGSPWRIGVERPLPGGRTVQKALTITATDPVTVLTSGTYRHYFDAEGIRYSHVLDARSGRPIMHDTVSVTVVDENSALADAWSTALLCLGVEEGRGAADLAGIAALFISERDGILTDTPTDAWSAMTGVSVQ